MEAPKTSYSDKAGLPPGSVGLHREGKDTKGDYFVKYTFHQTISKKRSSKEFSECNHWE